MPIPYIYICAHWNSCMNTHRKNATDLEIKSGFEALSLRKRKKVKCKGGQNQFTFH